MKTSYGAIIVGTDVYNQAIKEFKEGNANTAIEKMRSINSASPAFKSSLEALSKFYYKKEMYAELFALATFYRIRFKNHSDIDLSVLTLEILSLGKLCQFDSADKLLSQLKESYSLWRQEEIEKISKSYELLKKYSLKTEYKAPQYTGKYTWGMENEDLIKLNNPHKLRIKVENKCIK